MKNSVLEYLEQIFLLPRSKVNQRGNIQFRIVLCDTIKASRHEMAGQR